jgi:FkbM family methyltransferase
MQKIRPAIMNSYSQFGEDLEIEKAVGKKNDGFYVDVGANDPNRISNTKRFYKMGWNGMNIEPNFENHQKFVIERPRDINLNLGIGPQDGEAKFYIFDPNELSTFSSEEAQKYKALGYKLEKECDVRIIPLWRAIEEHSGGKEIDFLSVDAEGYDLQVLKSNNWEKFRPKVLCVEIAEHGSGKKQAGIEEYLAEIEYSLVKFNGLNGIYKDSRINTSLKDDIKKKI